MATPKTPIEFDYDLWTTEDGKCMVRVKSTGEVTEVDREVLRTLRGEEKRLRRSKHGVPVYSSTGDDMDAESTILSLSFVSAGDDMEPAWLEDPVRFEEQIATDMMEQDFIKILTDKQLDVYKECLIGGMSLRAFARLRGIDIRAVHDTKTVIQKKFEKFYARYSTND